jgi:hypothetical protein
MSFWTFCKLLAAVGVIAIMVFTGMLAYHVAVAPLGGVFAKIIPTPVQVAAGQTDAEIVKTLDSPEMPDIDPGEKAFQKAHESLAMGKLPEAREKLESIISLFPSSSSAPAARRIVGEMNLDEILSAAHMDGKKAHVVKRGDSFLGIAAQEKTTIDAIMHLNSMMELKGIQPGEEIIVMPLDFRILIEPHRKALSVWDGARFICEYPVLHIGGNVSHAQPKSQISGKFAELDGKRIQTQIKGYRGAPKIIEFGKPPVQIRGWDGKGPKPVTGILLNMPDLEELNLLTRSGNEVEIR